MSWGRIAAVATVAICASVCSRASADSGKWNFHAELGFGLPIAGEARPGASSERAGGGATFLTVDRVLSKLFAFELALGFGGFSTPFPGTGETGTGFAFLGAGTRLRLDDHHGYANEPGGDLAGSFWGSGHLGVGFFDGTQLGLDFATGYEVSIARPVSLGPFLRATFLLGGDHGAGDAILVLGLDITVELVRGAYDTDTDGDGISDSEERTLGTDPNKDDSDEDRIDDGVEVEGGTDPTKADSDSDGLRDGEEDLNRNGRREPEETNPLARDSDEGGVPDGEEHRLRMHPLDPTDDDADGDGVLGPHDHCPDTPPDATAGRDGCSEEQRPVEEPTEDEEEEAPEIGEGLTLEGLEFQTGRARLVGGSDAILERALRVLQADAELRVEIAGHTDSTGSERTNRRLSQQRAAAVRRWLIDHGIDRRRLEAHGYGSSQPIGDNETPEGRARNRRIELRPLR